MSLAAVGVSVRIGGTTLLEDASLSVDPGEVVAVVGPNGAGKSTLIRVLAGDVRPDAGSVLMLDRPMVEWSLRDRARRRAVMATDTPLAFPFTVAEVVALGLGPLGDGQFNARDHDLVRQLLEAVHCAALAERTYSTLSSGERQRVRLARSLAQIEDDAPTGQRRPRFLLLDEPTSSLDLAQQHAALRLVRQRAIDNDVGVIVVLHDLNLAASYADRIVLLKHGMIVEQGAPDAVLRSDVLELVFGIRLLVLRHPSLPRPVLVPDTGDDTATLG